MAWKLVNHSFYPSKKTGHERCHVSAWPSFTAVARGVIRNSSCESSWAPWDRRTLLASTWPGTAEIPQGPGSGLSSSKENMLGKEMVGSIPITWWDEKKMCFFNVIFRITFLYNPIPVFKSPFLWKSLKSTSIILFRGCFSPSFATDLS